MAERMTHKYLMIEDSAQVSYENFNEQSYIPDYFNSNGDGYNDNRTTQPCFEEPQKKEQPHQTSPNTHFVPLAKKRIVKMFPGETKNLPKNLCRAIKGFIESLFSPQQIQSNQALRQFMNKSKQKCGKEDIDNFLSTEIGRKVGDMFFGNLKFTSFFVRENKVDLDCYFRILDEYFLPNAVQEQ